MNNKESRQPRFVVSACLALIISAPAFAIDVTMKEEYIKVVDNAIVMFDTSSSMNEEFRDTGKSKRELVESEFRKRSGNIPDIGINFGVYSYTKWKVFAPVQPYNPDEFTAALDRLAEKGVGPTPLKAGLGHLEKILEKLDGRTAVFLFSDGKYTGEDPGWLANKLATNYDVCFYVISTAEEGVNNKLQKSVADLNACSRMIPLEDFLRQPDYQSGALYVTKSTMEGVRVKNSSFGFDNAELQGDAVAELDELAAFMTENPESYVVLSGYTDNVGNEDYNEGLSQRRVAAVAGYLTSKHGIDEDRIVQQWYGSDNPLVSNDTEEGQATNRRVEISVKGI